MDAGKTWVDRLQIRTLCWLAKGPGAAWLTAGTLAFAGLGAAALSAPSGAEQQDRGTISTSSLPLSSYGCYYDPDGDGHIFCDGSVAISRLPASFGDCHVDFDGDNAIFCDGNDR